MRIVVAIGGLLVALLAGLMLAVSQPWQKRTRVLSVAVPGSPCVAELWEKPHYRLGVGREYATWLVARPRLGQARWYVIDREYITFTDVTVLTSSALKTVRVEAGTGADAHMIAEYDAEHGTFRAASGPSVRRVKGWTVLAAAHVH